MITSISIQRLRGIREGRLDGLSPLTVLAGPNGCGKSTLLDALWMAASETPATTITQVIQRRREMLAGTVRWLLWKTGDEGPANITLHLTPPPANISYSLGWKRADGAQAQVGTLSWERLFDRPEPSAGPGAPIQGISSYGPIAMIQTDQEGNIDSSSSHAKLSQILPQGLPSVRFIETHAGGIHAPLHEAFTEAFRQGRKKEIVKLLSEAMPGLEDVAVLLEAGRPVVYFGFPDGGVPVALAGDGLRALTQLTCELAITSGNGLVLLEEPEIHQHPAAMRRTARVLWAATRRGVQIVLSTHSMDFLDSLVAEARDADTNNLSVFRILLDAGQVRASRFDGEDVLTARTQIGQDLR